MKSYFLGGCVSCTIFSSCFAACVRDDMCGAGNNYTITSAVPENCQTTNQICYLCDKSRYVVQRSCGSCISGYELFSLTSVEIGDNVYQTCVSSSNCSDWQKGEGNDTGYKWRECIKGGVQAFEAKCDNRYYGIAIVDSNGDFRGCKKCPDTSYATCDGSEKFHCLEGSYINGETCTECPPEPSGISIYSDYDSTSITQCRILSYTAFSDSTGKGIYKADCNYTK